MVQGTHIPKRNAAEDYPLHLIVDTVSSLLSPSRAHQMLRVFFIIRRAILSISKFNVLHALDGTVCQFASDCE